jgi:hypothetical protein
MKPVINLEEKIGKTVGGAPSHASAARVSA